MFAIKYYAYCGLIWAAWCATGVAASFTVDRLARLAWGMM